MYPNQDQQPQPAQPQPQQIVPPLAPQQYVPPVAVQPVAQIQDPGATLGLIGLILSFFTGPLAIIISSIGYSKSKKAGFSNSKAILGIIIGSIITIASIIYSTSSIITSNAEVEEFKRDCESKNGTLEETKSSYKCKYEIKTYVY